MRTQAAGKGNGRTASREARRQQLIDATIDSISKRGFSGTTLETVTRGANLSHGIVNFYFRTKEDLYLETLGHLTGEHYRRWYGAMTRAGPDPARQLGAIVDADFDRTICSRRKLAVWFAFWGQAKYRPNYLRIHSRYDDERFEEISRLCREIAADGAYGGLDPESVARCLESLVDGPVARHAALSKGGQQATGPQRLLRLPGRGVSRTLHVARRRRRNRVGTSLFPRRPVMTGPAMSRGPVRAVPLEPVAPGPATSRRRFRRVPDGTGSGPRRAPVPAGLRGVTAGAGRGVARTTRRCVHPSPDDTPLAPAPRRGTRVTSGPARQRRKGCMPAAARRPALPQARTRRRRRPRQPLGHDRRLACDARGTPGARSADRQEDRTCPRSPPVSAPSPSPRSGMPSRLAATASSASAKTISTASRSATSGWSAAARTPWPSTRARASSRRRRSSRRSPTGRSPRSLSTTITTTPAAGTIFRSGPVTGWTRRSWRTRTRERLQSATTSTSPRCGPCPGRASVSTITP